MLYKLSFENFTKELMIGYLVFKILFVALPAFFLPGLLIKQYIDQELSVSFGAIALVQMILLVGFFLPLQTVISRNLNDNSISFKKTGPFFFKEEILLEKNKGTFLVAEGKKRFYLYLTYHDLGAEKKIFITSQVTNIFRERMMGYSLKGRFKKEEIKEIADHLGLRIEFRDREISLFGEH